MINPETNHHEELALLPWLGAAITSAILWIQMLRDERKAGRNKTDEKEQKP